MLYALLFTTDHSVDNAYSLRSAAISPPENSKGGQMLGTQPVIISDLKFGTLEMPGGHLGVVGNSVSSSSDLECGTLGDTEENCGQCVVIRVSPARTM